jgi:uncharacterized protein DUF1761
MRHESGGINWLAVGVATIATFVIGGVWYGAVFVESWPVLHELSEARIASAQDRFLLNMGVILAGDFVRAVVVALLIKTMGVTGFAQGLRLGFLVWLGFSLTFDLGWALSASMSPAGFAIDSSYRLVCLLVAGAVIASWRKSGASVGVPLVQ